MMTANFEGFSFSNLMKSMSKASARMLADASDLTRHGYIRGGLPKCCPGAYDSAVFRMCGSKIALSCQKRYVPWLAHPEEQTLWNRHHCLRDRPKSEEPHGNGQIKVVLHLCLVIQNA